MVIELVPFVSSGTGFIFTFYSNYGAILYRLRDDDYSVRRSAGQHTRPILFVLYVADVVRLVQLHGFNVHQYADDTHLYSCCHPDNSASLCRDLCIFIEDVARWTCLNRLQLNTRKTEFMWCRRHKLLVDQLTIQSTSVASCKSVHDLGMYLDSDMSMHKHVMQLVCSCYGVLRKLRSVRRRRLLPCTALTTLVSSFIMSKVDYCNVVLAGLPQRDLDHVQSVVSVAARLSADAHKYDHVTPLLRDLHWLRVPECVKFKLCVLVHRCFTGAAPQYLTAVLRGRCLLPVLLVIACAWCHLLILLCLPLAVQPSVTVHSLLPVHERGTASNIYIIIRHV